MADRTGISLQVAWVYCYQAFVHTFDNQETESLET